jgi:hypothetical protein
VVTRVLPPAAGAGLWLVLALWRHPSPRDPEWGALLLLFAALVLVPLGLRLAEPTRLSRLALLLQLPAALLLAASTALPEGPTAALLAAPWLATTALVSFDGLLRAWRRRFRPLDALCRDAAFLFLAVGGGWTVLSRAGARPLDFDPAVVLLTAIHFHYAGFVLPLLAGLAARDTAGWAGRAACAGVVAGVPLVAAGITAAQLGFGALLECAAALLTAAAGVLAAGLHLGLAARKDRPAAARALWNLAALSLLAGMALAALYGVRSILPVSPVDIPFMRATHGTLNAIGFALGGLLGWTAATPPRSRNA